MIVRARVPTFARLQLRAFYGYTFARSFVTCTFDFAFSLLRYARCWLRLPILRWIAGYRLDVVVRYALRTHPVLRLRWLITLQLDYGYVVALRLILVTRLPRFYFVRCVVDCSCWLFVVVGWLIDCCFTLVDFPRALRWTFTDYVVGLVVTFALIYSCAFTVTFTRIATRFTRLPRLRYALFAHVALPRIYVGYRYVYVWLLPRLIAARCCLLIPVYVAFTAFVC